MTSDVAPMDKLEAGSLKFSRFHVPLRYYAARATTSSLRTGPGFAFRSASTYCSETAMDLQLDEKLALVTASTDGIGKEIAESLAREGAIVIVNGRTTASVDAAIAENRKSVPDAKLESLAADNGTGTG